MISILFIEYLGLKNLLKQNGDVAKEIITTSESSYDVSGSTVSHKLVRNGKEITVTNENR